MRLTLWRTVGASAICLFASAPAQAAFRIIASAGDPAPGGGVLRSLGVAGMNTSGQAIISFSASTPDSRALP